MAVLHISTGVTGGSALKPERIRTVVADDDARVRDDLRAVLELEADIEVVATVPDGAAAVAACLSLAPDVAVLDIRMPVMDGIEASARIQAAQPGCRVLIVTTFDLDEYVLGAVRAGAAGFLLKEQAVQVLADAVRIAAAGEGIVSPRATARLLQEFVRPAQLLEPGRSLLTVRELEIVQLIARGLSNEHIATLAFITRATVKTHVSSILNKLGLTSRLQVVVWAYENGAVQRSLRG